MSGTVFGLDIETHSYADLPKVGAHAYFAVPGTECLIVCWHPVGDKSPVRAWRRGQPVPDEICDHVASGGSFSGWNVVGFDRIGYAEDLVRNCGFPPVDDGRWLDSMHRAAHANLPRSLDGCAEAVGLPFEAGFKNRNRLLKIADRRRTPELSDDDWEWLENRCIQDVWMEEGVLLRLPPWPTVPPWATIPAMDRKINDRGILMDFALVEGMRMASLVEFARLDRDMHRITSGAVEKATNVEALKVWLDSKGVELPLAVRKPDSDDREGEDDEEPDPPKGGSKWRLRKGDFADLIARDDIPEECRQALEIRWEVTKGAAARKLPTMLGCASPDGRLRGALVLGGAQQTLRWSGSKWQPHNFQRAPIGNPDEVEAENGIKAKENQVLFSWLSNLALSTAIAVGRSGSPDLVRAVYGPVLPFVSRMMRRTLCASRGRLFLNGDYAQIEARLTAWLAQQTDTLAAFAAGVDVYRIEAGKTYRKRPEDVTKRERQIGKVEVLALGFGGGVNAFGPMALNYGIKISHKEASPIVKAWRAANPAIVALWYAVDDAAAAAVANPGREYPVPPLGLVSYRMSGDCLVARLPSGRHLRYWQPRLSPGQWPDGSPKERPDLSGLAVKGRAVFRRSLYHTILVENLIQAIAVDLLADGLVHMEEAGLPVPLHVHDSIAAEEDEDVAESRMSDFKSAMLFLPDWARGLPLAIDTEISTRFG